MIRLLRKRVDVCPCESNGLWAHFWKNKTTCHKGFGNCQIASPGHLHAKSKQLEDTPDRGLLGCGASGGEGGSGDHSRPLDDDLPPGLHLGRLEPAVDRDFRVDVALPRRLHKEASEFSGLNAEYYGDPQSLEFVGPCVEDRQHSHRGVSV